MDYSEKAFNSLTNLYSVSKTLRFALIPQGKTEEFITNNNIITASWENGKSKLSGQDYVLAENYTIVKKMLDKTHELFITDALSEKCVVKFNNTLLQNEKIENFLQKHLENWKNKGKPESVKNYTKLSNSDRIIQSKPRRLRSSDSLGRNLP